MSDTKNKKSEIDLTNLKIACVKLPSGEVVIAQVSNRIIHESGKVTIDLTFAYQICESYDSLTDEYEMTLQQFMPYMPVIRLDMTHVVLSGFPSSDLLQDYFQFVQEDIVALEAMGEEVDYTKDEEEPEQKDKRVLH